VVPKLLALALGVGALGLGYTKYTAPIHGGPAYADLHELITRALGDTQPMLPGPPPALPLDPVRPGTGTAEPQLGAHVRTDPATASDTVTTTQPREWAAWAAAHDPAALRAWLGSAVVPATVVRGDRAETTLLRVTLARGCPLVSVLTARFVGQAVRRPRLVHVAADCPRSAQPSPIESLP
jgi:hypothetical protein